jgi:hypothetical protein
MSINVGVRLTARFIALIAGALVLMLLAALFLLAIAMAFAYPYFMAGFN